MRDDEREDKRGKVKKGWKGGGREKLKDGERKE